MLPLPGLQAFLVCGLDELQGAPVSTFRRIPRS